LRFVRQSVGLVDSVLSCRAVVEAFIGEFADAMEEMQRLAEARI
jgi:hypothetical protein